MAARQKQPRASQRRKLSAPSLASASWGFGYRQTRQYFTGRAPTSPETIGMAIQLHIRAGRIQERTSTSCDTPQRIRQHATAGRGIIQSAATQFLQLVQTARPG